MAAPFETIIQLQNIVTGATFTCVSNKLDSPYQFRTAILRTIGNAGGIDAHAGARDPMEVRTVTTTLLYVYNQNLPPARQAPGLVESFTSVYARFDAVCGQGYPVLATLRDANGNLWYNQCRVKSVAKSQTLDAVSHVEIAVTFEFFTPYWYAQYKAGALRADTGLIADGIPAIAADADPDKFALTGTTANHVVSNTGVAGGTMPDYTAGITLVGPIKGPVNIVNYSVPSASGGPIYLIYNADIQPNETVTIDGANFDVTSNFLGPAAYTHLIVPYEQGQDNWFVIAPGVNTVALSYGAGTNGYATLNYLPYKL